MMVETAVKPGVLINQNKYNTDEFVEGNQTIEEPHSAGVATVSFSPCLMVRCGEDSQRSFVGWHRIVVAQDLVT
ncbi:hypothetical protein JOD24_000344 [Kroppenstedtia sanguinis]